MPEIVALDLGNVCVKVDSAACLEKLGAPSLADIPASFLKACEDFETGRADQTMWLQAFREATEGRFSDAYLLDAFCSIIRDEMAGMDGFVRGLVSEGYRVVLLSDTSPLHLDVALRKLSFSHLITGGVYSFEAGARKPAAPMYETLEARYGKPCFFTDDRPENVEAAKGRGWPAAAFVSAADCREAFRSALGKGPR